jgi:Zn-finger nucleic acid-binding protein
VVCTYCGSRQEVDLQGWSRAEAIGPCKDLRCPDGHGPLEEVRLGREGNLRLGRCPTCLGLFLTPEALEQLLLEAVLPVEEVNRTLLDQLVNHPRREAGSFRYKPCPRCGELMNRRLFGKRSGVILDRCRDHGSWLDAGELRQLMEWTRAGGRIHNQERELEEEEAAARRQRLVEALADVGGLHQDPALLQNDLSRLLAGVLRRLVR